MTRTQRTILTVGEDGVVTAIHVTPLEPDMSRRLWGWKSIGEALNRSWRWAQKWGERNRSGRMPVSWVEKRPTITLRALTAWLESKSE